MVTTKQKPIVSIKQTNKQTKKPRHTTILKNQEECKRRIKELKNSQKTITKWQ